MKRHVFVLTLIALSFAGPASAEVVTLKGINGKFANLDVVRLGSVALVARGADGNEMAIKWANIDLAYLAEKYPELERRRQRALSGADEVDAVFRDDTAAAPVVTLDAVRAQFVATLQDHNGAAEKLLADASDPSSAGHKAALSALTGIGEVNSVKWLAEAIKQADAEAAKLPPAEAASFRYGALAPALRSIEEMRKNPKAAKHEWQVSFRRLADAVGIKAGAR